MCMNSGDRRQERQGFAEIILRKIEELWIDRHEQDRLKMRLDCVQWEDTSVTIDDIANFCEFKDCSVVFGSPEIGFVQVDGIGVTTRFNNYRRFLLHHELGSLASPRKVLQEATVFRIQREGGEELRDLSREEFEQELREFQERVGI